MFELTGALTYILPTMVSPTPFLLPFGPRSNPSAFAQIVVMVTKAVSEFFDQGGIADQAIRFNGLPSLDKEDVAFNKPGETAFPRQEAKFFSLRLASGIHHEEGHCRLYCQRHDPNGNRSVSLV